MDVGRYVHSSPCEHQRGLVGGNDVSLPGPLTGASDVTSTWSRMITLENDLRGQTRPVTRCPLYDYIPKRDVISSREIIKPVEHPVISLGSLESLPSCQMLEFGNMPGPNSA
jgi:hypothetical protein